MQVCKWLSINLESYRYTSLWHVLLLLLCLTDFAIVKAKYAEILSCFPENFEATINCLQNYLSDSDICNILSLTSDQNQKLLNLLILRLKNKEDLLDFCDNLEKIDGASPSLKDIAEQLRKRKYVHMHITTLLLTAIIMYVYSYTLGRLILMHGITVNTFKTGS